MTQYIVWAWHPSGWTYRIVTSWEEALEAYQEAKADTTGPVYLCEVKAVRAKLGSEKFYLM